MPPATLQQILAPVSAEAFLGEYWLRNFKHIPGPADKFAGLMPWQELNRILAGQRLDQPRLRLAIEGKSVPAERYTDYRQDKRRPFHPIPRLRGDRLVAELREGATLIVDAIEEAYAPLGELCASLEFLFRTHVQANLYAGWRKSHGFDVHWDDHEVLVLQVAGRKRWQVYGLTRPFPLKGDPRGTPPREPIWEETLEAGGVLYIPRGWWHVAFPMDEPSLHLTIGITNATGVDLLNYAMQAARQVDCARMDLDVFSSKADRERYAATLREQVAAFITPDIVTRFLDSRDAAAGPRTRFALPHGATPETLPEGGNPCVRLNVRRPAKVTEAGGVVEVEALGKRWRFHPYAGPLLQALAERPCTLDELYGIGDPELAPGAVRRFVKDLVVQGLATAG